MLLRHLKLLLDPCEIAEEDEKGLGNKAGSPGETGLGGSEEDEGDK